MLLGSINRFALRVSCPPIADCWTRPWTRALDKDSPLARRLLLRWGRLHAVRSVLSGCALVVFGECLNRMT